VVSVAQFKRRFGEFSDADENIIAEALLEAESRVAADVWGDRRANGVKYLAAHLVSLSPAGEKMRLSVGSKADKGETVYYAEFIRMRRARVSGFRVI
jgi:hypothetical protein